MQLTLFKEQKTPLKEISLRPHQLAVKRALAQTIIDKEKRILVLAPCGWGKTIFAGFVLKDVIKRNKKALFVVPFRTLVEQAVESFKALGLEAGVLAGNYPENREALIQIATIQTLANSRDFSWLSYDVVILDEVHILGFSEWFKQNFPLLRSGEEMLSLSQFDNELSMLGFHQAFDTDSPTWKEVSDKWKEMRTEADDYQKKAYYILKKYKDLFKVNKKPNNKIIIGLTGSPFRLDKKQFMSDIFDVQIAGQTPAEMITLGLLVGCQYFRVKGIDTKGVHVKNGDFNQDELSVVCSDPEVIASAVQNYKTICPDRLFICFAVDVKHAKLLKEEFVSQGINAHVIEANTPDKTRQKLFKQLGKGEIQGLISVGCLSVGFDDPEISCVMSCRPTMSIALWIQQVGRGMRTADGKIDCYVLDQAGNLGTRFPRIEDLTYPELEDNDFEVKPTPMKECPECQRWALMFDTKCVCGHIFESFAEEKEKIKPIGEMELYIEEKDKKLVQYYHKKLKEAFKKGYAPEWAAMQFNQQYKRFPKREWALNGVFRYLNLDGFQDFLNETRLGTKKITATQEIWTQWNKDNQLSYLKYLDRIILKKQTDPNLSEEKKSKYNDKWKKKHFYNEFGVVYDNT